jgi:cephalosporin-C deacetylase
MAKHNPATYQLTLKNPDDFDAFWADVMAEANAIPLKPTLTPVPMRSDDEVEVFEAHYTSLNHLRIAGWYCLPRQRSGPLPTIVVYPGYISEPTLPKDWARQGYAAFGAAPRGKLRSNARFNPGYPGLLTHNITDRHTYGYKGFYVDAIRAIDFLLAQPEVDATRIGLTGGSQGGALTILVAAMRNDVVAAAAPQAPYLCGYMDSALLTHTYPYEEMNEYARLHPGSAQAMADALNYYDLVNFAPRITCPIIVNIGLQDDVVPPETGYAVFNAISSVEKKLFAYDGYGHDANVYEHGALINQFFDERLKSGARTTTAANLSGF